MSHTQSGSQFRALGHVERVCVEYVKSHINRIPTETLALGHVERVCEAYSSHTSVESRALGMWRECMKNTKTDAVAACSSLDFFMSEPRKKIQDSAVKCFHDVACSASPPENIPTPPDKRLVESLPERPDTPLGREDPSVLMTGAHVEVTSRLPTPPLMTRCDKSTQTNSPCLELGKTLGTTNSLAQ
ncbi:hypothetical protein TNCT_247531 [Trichonephila clavata]|uniref:Uncharacterized protein n=1 Tax=Trichonephila clavata TaxID=2740835 RepID=A0A8X6GL52_TRICU|nr:hypothetical protein TNCT_247531 [Trichonephila clavata]